MRIIAGKFKGRSLKTPKGSATRPTQSMLREAVFNICQSEIEGARFLDLFAGSGSMGLEALSRGASQTVFVEQNRHAVQCIQENLRTLEIDARIIPASIDRALHVLVSEKALFDLIYIDPPYDLNMDLSQSARLLEKTGTLFLEQRHSHPKITTIPGLIAKSTRRFGDAMLTIFSLEG